MSVEAMIKLKQLQRFPELLEVSGEAVRPSGDVNQPSASNERLLEIQDSELDEWKINKQSRRFKEGRPPLIPSTVQMQLENPTKRAGAKRRDLDSQLQPANGPVAIKKHAMKIHPMITGKQDNRPKQEEERNKIREAFEKEMDKVPYEAYANVNFLVSNIASQAQNQSVDLEPAAEPSGTPPAPVGFPPSPIGFPQGAVRFVAGPFGLQPVPFGFPPGPFGFPPGPFGFQQGPFEFPPGPIGFVPGLFGFPPGPHGFPPGPFGFAPGEQ